MSDLQENTYVIDTESGAEIARLTDQDRLMTRTMGTLLPHTLALSTASHILDVACGPGGWATDVAFQYPEINVTGIDISQSMIQYANAQAKVRRFSNLNFLVMDILQQTLAFADNSFDVVNARFMISFMHKEAWPRVIGEFMRVLRPGGILTLTEVDDWGISTSAALERLKCLFYRAFCVDGRCFESDGRHFGITPMLRQFLQDAGCQNISEQAYVLNSSRGMKTYESNYKNFQYLLKLVQPFVLKMNVTTQEELDALYEQALIEMLSHEFHALWYFFSTWGEKPKSCSV
ncbi:MAG: hypothetical protein NVSMB38_41250 [Ktedonobacteraceae bacterium]